MTNSENKDPLLIIDGYGFIFRAYHVQPPLTSPNGEPVGAIYGLCSMLIKILSDFKPKHAVMVLDHGGKTFRNDIYKDYKAHRPPAPPDLVTQLKLVQTAAEALNFKCLSKQGFEADDIIATLAHKASNTKRKAIIISSDKDLMQLVDDYVAMFDPSKSKYITNDDIIAKFGVSANKVREVQALMGDKSDNIPGVAGFGPKTASQLINQFGSVDALFESIDQLTPRHQQLLNTHREDALISWQLVGLDHNVDINQDVESFGWEPPSLEKITDFLNINGFKSLNKRIENLFQLKIISIENNQTPIISAVKQDNIVSIRVTKSSDLDALIQNIQKTGRMSVMLKKYENNTILNISDNINIYEIEYIEKTTTVDLFSFSDSSLDNTKIWQIITELLSNPAIKKITYNLKELLQTIDFKINSCDDLMLMDYAMNAGNKARDVLLIMGIDLVKPEHLILYYSDCYDKLIQELVQNRALHLYDSLDLPLCYILYDMEKVGVKINTNYLKSLSNELAIKITELEKKIYTLAGQEFNISSPKQLGCVLFENMKLPFGKAKGKSEAYSTNVDVLEKLNAEGYEIAQLLLDYRHLTKLKNTYTDSLPKQVDNYTNRIHTTFLQCATSTGRLSSINPNVQNIPIRTDEGLKIRAAFIASEGNKLISADYSQIELRILSHVANIETLKKAFLENKDIHAQTASQIFDIPIDEITPEIRRKAKAINFGIIYGISGFGLAKQLGISQKEANDYIKKYFEKYPGIQKYMSETIEFAKENNFIENLVGRKCFVPAINNKNHALRSFGERAAINAPMQSLASDIVKIAMVKLHKELKQKNLKTKMILQIHDELIFEAPDSEIDIAMPLIKKTMEECFSEIILNVSINSGSNWREIH